jgi:hypothetical protein
MGGKNPTRSSWNNSLGDVVVVVVPLWASKLVPNIEAATDYSELGHSFMLS